MKKAEITKEKLFKLVEVITWKVENPSPCIACEQDSSSCVGCTLSAEYNRQLNAKVRESGVFNEWHSSNKFLRGFITLYEMRLGIHKELDEAVKNNTLNEDGLLHLKNRVADIDKEFDYIMESCPIDSYEKEFI